MSAVKHYLADLVFAEILLSDKFTPCDRCGDTARAVTEVVHPGWASELKLCGHHARKHFGYESTAYEGERESRLKDPVG